jgi:hypothetical protein
MTSRRSRPFRVLLLGALLVLPGVPATAAGPAAGPSLRVDVRHGRHPISADIYGVNFASDIGSTSAVAKLGITVDRWGGNSTTRYDWTTGIHNTGSDWYFENIPADGSTPAHLRLIAGDRAAGRHTVLTVPTIGWIPLTDSPAKHPYACGFPTDTYPGQQSTDPYDDHCGNGVHGNEHTITGNDPAVTSRAVDQGYVADLIDDLVSRYGAASAGGVRYIELDNEPSLWDSTHRDVHPDPLTYDELTGRAIAYAKAIKTSDPSAKVVGPSDWGWCAYLYSPADPDHCSAGTDRAAHGGVPMAAWYLAALKAYQDAHGTRLLDVFDEHYYPQSGVALRDAGSASLQRKRLRSTRSLWDPTYNDESWISDTAPGGVAVRLIPRMHAWVDTNYPGTRLGITEYNFGGLESLNGALTQADVLGILGREDVQLATLWAPGTATQPWAFAFRMFRGPGGSGSRFGTTSVLARSFSTASPSRPNGGQDSLAVYAAERSDQTLTVVVINKTGSALRSSLRLIGASFASRARMWRYDGSDLHHIHQLASATVNDGVVRQTYPAGSITLLVVPRR